MSDESDPPDRRDDSVTASPGKGLVEPSDHRADPDRPGVGPTEEEASGAGSAGEEPRDGGPTDAGPTDAGPTDAGPTDAGPTDAGVRDGGSDEDGDPEAGHARPDDDEPGVVALPGIGEVPGMGEAPGIGRATAVMAVGTTLSRVTGVIRIFALGLRAGDQQPRWRTPTTWPTRFPTSSTTSCWAAWCRPRSYPCSSNA